MPLTMAGLSGDGTELKNLAGNQWSLKGFCGENVPEQVQD